MYCPDCRCEFVGWSRRCPVCETPLVEAPPAPLQTTGEPIAYEALVGLVKENGGKLSIEVSTTDVGKEHRWSFPYSGYGFAWAKGMQGVLDSVSVALQTTEVGMDKKHGFPYRAYRFAWAKGMEGHIGGNQVTLASTEVVLEKKWGFPYQGFGYAWMKTMSGTCGQQLIVDLRTTEAGRDKRIRFPYRGYGFAWARKGVLTLTLNQQL